LQRLEETAAASDRRVVELEEATQAAKREREALAIRSGEETDAVHATRERFDGVRLEIDELEASMRTLRGDLDERRETMNEVELGLQEINLERQHLLNDVDDRFDARLTDALLDYHDRRRAGADERARQKDLKRILSRLGEVNLTAIDEFEEVKTRFEYLSGQKADLEHAIAQLAEAIDRINRTTRDLFKKTFDAVDERFQQLFPRLFGGGHAQLKMTDPSDMLATGVEIEARPPGKQPRTLDLLSGGEKALTAVSLIFAIFLIKPSPFCLLDEVDAPLDDANVGRFCQLVRELAGQTQFVIITHNKVTMEMADRLYGVTMEQRGVSKMVSVNLRRAVEIAYN
jgi:chromosome segregation protein